MKPSQGRRASRIWCVAATIGAALALASLPCVSAQEQTSPPQGTAQQPSAPQQPAPAPAQPAPNRISQADAELVVELVRTTLVAVHQANVTGNYTVLRDLAAPGFRDRNSAADLAQIFAPIRQQKIDLGPVVYLDPQLSQAGINGQGMLHLAGRLATRPVPVSFELLFQSVSGVWKPFGISIAPLQQPAALAPAPAPAPNTGAAQPPPATSPLKSNAGRHPRSEPSNAGRPAQPSTQSR